MKWKLIRFVEQKGRFKNGYIASRLQPKTLRKFLHSILSNRHKLDGSQSMFTQNVTENIASRPISVSWNATTHYVPRIKPALAGELVVTDTAAFWCQVHVITWTTTYLWESASDCTRFCCTLDRIRCICSRPDSSTNNQLQAYYVLADYVILREVT